MSLDEIVRENYKFDRRVPRPAYGGMGGVPSAPAWGR
jgi:hypothetical protein